MAAKKTAQTKTDTFTGFPDAEGKFWKQLAKNQNREWFQKHKTEYETGWNAPMELLLTEVHAKLDAAYKHCDLDEPRVFRIYRNLRFSADKSPYKTHIGGILPIKRAARTLETPIALYFHVGADGVRIAAGLYSMEGEALARFRAAVIDETRGKELDKILRALEKRGYDTDSVRYAGLKKVPKGFDPDHPRAELLKRKGLGVAFPNPPKGTLTSAKLVPYIVEHVKKAVPLVEWLVFATA